MPLPATNREQQLMRLGLLSALAIGIHNFPEGLATFVAALHDTKVGIPIAIAIALHNIPEGIAVAVQYSMQPGAEEKLLYILLFPD
jgi:ZIP family zinc transporter